MEYTTITIIVMLLCAFGPDSGAAAGKHKGGHLHVNYYARTCPQAEQIVTQAVEEAINADIGIAAALLRLHFHDCWIGGCDASILLDRTKFPGDVEMASPANKKSVRGLEVIDNAKAKLEAACPGIVSCADIVAFAARDAAVNAGLNSYLVPAGRRDGTWSLANDTIRLPGTGNSVAQMTTEFAQRGLSQQDMVTLLGAHSIGTAHCSTFQDRYNNLPTSYKDPTLDPAYAAYLAKMCPIPAIQDGFVYGAQIPLDSITPNILDNKYYVGLMSKRALLRVDQTLMNDPNTSEIVKSYAADPARWAKNFAKSIVRLGRMGVLTGAQGEIRRQCGLAN